MSSSYESLKTRFEPVFFLVNCCISLCQKLKGNTIATVLNVKFLKLCILTTQKYLCVSVLQFCQRVIRMAFSKYKGFHKKKLSSELTLIVSSLRKENEYLKKTLEMMSHHQSEHIKLVEVTSYLTLVN